MIGGLFGRTSFGLLFVERVFLPERVRGYRLGSRVIALAEEEAKRRGCTRAALFTLTFQAPGFYPQAGLRHRCADRLPPARSDTYAHDQEALSKGNPDADGGVGVCPGLGAIASQTAKS